MKEISKKKIMIVLVAITCAFLVVSFAQDLSETSTDVETTYEESVVDSKGMVNLLQLGPIYDFNGSKSYGVTPEKGQNLIVQVSARGSEVTVKVKKKNESFYSSSVTIPSDGNLHTQKMASNCNGEEYEICFQTNGNLTLLAFISQTQNS